MYITFLDKNGGGGGTSGVVVTTKTVNVSSNPQTITANTGYAWSAVTINSNNVYSSGYTDGYTSGYTDASALIPVITGESYTYAEDDDFVKTISAQTGTAFSAVTVDATNKFVSGYKLAAGDVDSYSEELTVSANGVYNADIQYDVRGYFKKVTVDVPSYGVVADLSNIYFDGFDIPISGVAAMSATFSFIDNNNGPSQRLFDIKLSGTGVVNRVDVNAYVEYSGSTKYLHFLVVNVDSHEQEDYTLPMSLGDNIEVQINKVSNNQIGANLRNCTKCTSENIPVFYIPEVETIHVSEVGDGSSPTYISEGLYFKSFKRTGSPSIRQNIVVRSDGKLWDVKNDQEYPFTWYNGNQGTSGDTFNTLYEWDI